MTNELIFLAASSSQRDIDLLIADADGRIDAPTQTFQPSERMAHLMVRVGLFQSVGEARRNGWDKPVPVGFSRIKVGKAKRVVTILNMAEDQGGNTGS